MYNNAINKNIIAIMRYDNHSDLVPNWKYKVKHVELGSREFVVFENAYCFYPVDDFKYFKDGKEINIRDEIKPIRVPMVEAIRRMIAGGK